MGGYVNALIGQSESPDVGRAAIRVITITLSSAQLLTISAVPVQVLPSPGPGKTYIVHGSLAHFIFGGIAYTAGANLRLTLGTFAQGFWIACLGSLINVLVDTFSQGTENAANVPATAQVNLPLMVTSSSSPITGNGAMILTVFYSVVDTTLSQ